MARSPGHKASKAIRKDPQKSRIDLIQELLAKSTNQQQDVGSEEKDLLIIHSSLNELIEIEKDYEIALPDRKGKFDKFLSWVAENGLDSSRIEVTILDPVTDECGLKCTRFDLKEGEPIMEIPRKLMLTNEIEDKNANFESFGKSDLMMKTMANVRLAMVLINEHTYRDSFWKPYIDILPSKYVNHPLYMDIENLLALKPSPTFTEAVKMIKSVARQYCYFYTQMLTPKSLASCLHFKKNFTFNLYRWAVVTTMTRQNLIPALNKSSGDCGSGLSVNALIPVWDMCNHDHGQFSTDFNLDTCSALCYAMKPFKVGDEICIFYGPRSNGEFLIHNGFVFGNNQYDSLPIKLGISKSDPLYQLKSDLCNKCSLPEVGLYNLKPKIRGMDEKMRLFLRIFHSDKDQLETCLKEADPVKCLKDDSMWMDLVDPKIDVFIQTRAALLDRSYESTKESRVGKIIQSQLIESERKILQSHFQ